MVKIDLRDFSHILDSILASGPYDFITEIKTKIFYYTTLSLDMPLKCSVQSRLASFKLGKLRI